MDGRVTFAGRAAVIALVFAVSRTLGGALASRLEPSALMSMFGSELVAGTVVGTWSAALATRMTGSAARAGAALACLIFVNLAAVMIEGAAFEPSALDLSAFPFALIVQLFVAALVAFAAIGLARPRSEVVLTLRRRTAVAWTGRYALCVLVYVVLYFVVGAVNFLLVTGPYYRSGVAGLVLPPPDVVLVVAIVEGGLFPIAIALLARAMGSSPRGRAFAAGTSMAVLGGVVPLILAPSLPPPLRVSSAIEIFLQKFPTGAVAAMLLGPEQTTQPGMSANPVVR